MVSIGIPFYNSEKFLRDAIRSIFAQTYRDWELILVDDGSTDGSLSIANSVKDQRVRVFSDGKHRGLIERLNQIISVSNGIYIARMDADDLMHPRRIELEERYLRAHPEVDVVGTAMYSLAGDYSVIGKRSAEPDFNSPAPAKVKGFIHVSIMAKKQWFVSHSYDTRFVRAEDQELWARSYKNSNFANLPMPLMYVREIESVNFSKYAQSARTIRKIILTYSSEESGFPVTLLLVLQSYLKVILYAIAGLFRCQHLLVRGRNVPLSLEEKKSAGEALGEVLKTAVKGLESESAGH